MEQIVAAGGYGGGGAFLDTVDVYDISLDTWTTGMRNKKLGHHGEHPGNAGKV